LTQFDACQILGKNENVGEPPSYRSYTKQPHISTRFCKRKPVQHCASKYPCPANFNYRSRIKRRNYGGTVVVSAPPPPLARRPDRKIDRGMHAEEAIDGEHKETRWGGGFSPDERTADGTYRHGDPWCGRGGGGPRRRRATRAAPARPPARATTPWPAPHRLRPSAPPPRAAPPAAGPVLRASPWWLPIDGARAHARSRLLS
jgi:hypothetical protein